MPNCDPPSADYSGAPRLSLAVLEDAGRITAVAGEYTAAAVFALEGGDRAGGFERGIDLIIRMLGRGGRPFRPHDYQLHGVSLECFVIPGLDYVGGHNGQRDYLHLHGRHEDIAVALASLALTVRSDSLHECRLQVVVADACAAPAGWDWYGDTPACEPTGFAHGPVLALASVGVSILAL
ncbi:hypothetical protein GSY71_07725 [Pusillimonas sp. TS35]|uniref:hypothetical protein n=1 Tax=Paracandidimonas lactea TaxID=2895524 RepID=UPI00136ED0CF|nr:hypothetical protein [Paracandidimonas lactea]MYN13035.1 hypothetical protein [Pusillimonas sp. TS35]